jgi:phage shock protein A
MSITPSPLSSSQEPNGNNTSYSSPPSGGPRSRWPLIVLAAVVVIGFIGLFLYAKSLNDRLEDTKRSLDGALASQGETIQRLSRRLEQSDARANDLQGTITVTQNRLGMTQSEIRKAHQIAADLAKQQQEAEEAAAKLGSQLGQLQQEQATTKGAVGSLSTDVTGVKGEVQSTKQELAATKSQLQRVVGDLGVQSDLIAHSRADLDELRLRGERDYVEFDLKKANKRQKVGSVQLELKNADPKRLKYTLGLTVDDKSTEKKDKTVFEPVQFYQQGFGMPSEIVVNQIYKDRVVGYISTPKKKESRTPMKAQS